MVYFINFQVSGLTQIGAPDLAQARHTRAAIRGVTKNCDAEMRGHAVVEMEVYR